MVNIYRIGGFQRAKGEGEKKRTILGGKGRKDRRKIKLRVPARYPLPGYLYAHLPADGAAEEVTFHIDGS